MWLRSGRLVDPLDLDLSKVTLTDLAWSLAHTMRWGGHANPAISVAQHCVAMAREAWPNPRLALLCLHHDDGEAFFGDMLRDLKAHPNMRWYAEQEHRATELCVRHFAPQLDDLPISAAKELDRRSLLTERAMCFPADKDKTSYHPEESPLPWSHFEPYNCSGGYWAGAWLSAHSELVQRLQGA